MRWTALIALAALAACGHKGAPSNGTANAAAANASANVSAPKTPLPPANSANRFVGTWAASKAECTSKPWRFTVKELNGPEDHKCTFYKISKAPDGYDIAATCPAKKPVPSDLIKLRFADSAGIMLLESNAIPPTGLVYCGN